MKAEGATVGPTTFLTFRLGDEDYAVGVESVLEILDLAPITRLPRMPEGMLGIINLRGRVVPVVDLHLRFRLPGTLGGKDRSILVLEVPLDGGTSVVGAVVDSVEEVCEIPAGGLQPAPRMGRSGADPLLRGMAEREGKLVIVLDAGRVFSASELGELAAAG